MEVAILAAVIAVIFLTVGYRVAPFREADGSKPLFVFLPKYKKLVTHSKSNAELENELSRFGFEKVREDDAITYFTRGSVLGDFSINLAKVDVALREITPNQHELTVQAGWVAAFDTGDHWQFITELGRELEDI